MYCNYFERNVIYVSYVINVKGVSFVNDYQTLYIFETIIPCTNRNCRMKWPVSTV